MYWGPQILLRNVLRLTLLFPPCMWGAVRGAETVLLMGPEAPLEICRGAFFLPTAVDHKPSSNTYSHWNLQVLALSGGLQTQLTQLNSKFLIFPLTHILPQSPPSQLMAALFFVVRLKSWCHP